MTTKPPAAVARLPAAPGVYRFVDGRGCPIYIGRATDLRGRVASYWGNLGDRQRLAPMVARITGVEAVACDSVHEAAWLERNLLEHRKPRWNRAIGGQEVPVAIQVGSRPSAPGLTVVHEPWPSDGVRRFGPYLGGTKVRLAVAALRRVLPVGYASALSGSGQDLARTLGVDRRDREALLQRLVALLERDPAAVASVRTELHRRRDKASRDHAFERAGQLHAEMTAIEWVVAEQKVTILEPCDFDVHGWADGVLVSFGVRGGRLSSWEQRQCSEASAQPLVDASPAGYAAFAHRNAVLAAHLISR